MKVLITGSHFTPAQAVITELQKHQVEIVYVGRSSTREGDSTPSIESQILPGLGVKFIPITTGRLQRHFSILMLYSLLKVPVGFLQAVGILLKEQPSVILSFGGYVSVPLIIVGWLLSIPIIIHEQTLVSGLANTISSWFASKIAVSFNNHQYAFSRSKLIVTGNPLRREILAPVSKASSEYEQLFALAKKDKLPILLITGGNQGSHTLNQTVLQSLEELLSMACIIHQTGDSLYHDYEQLVEQSNSLKHRQRYLVKKWIDAADIGVIFRKANLAISRAGINTLLELAYLGLPTIVIPLPHIYQDEQVKNAHFFSKVGLAKVLLQKDLNKTNLLAQVQELIEQLSVWRKIAKQAKEVVIPDSAQRVAQETIILAHSR